LPNRGPFRHAPAALADKGGATGTVSPGKLILVVGPSGAGKDTLIDAARAHFAGEPGMLFCERCITRMDQTGEPHAALSEAEFARVAKAGGFFLAWQAHGLSYGVTAEIVDILGSGTTVVVNTSRRIIADARRKWPGTHVVHVTAAPEVLRERLKLRGRETSAAVDHRLRRGIEVGCPQGEWVVEVDNSGALADGVARFNAALAALISA